MPRGRNITGGGFTQLGQGIGQAISDRRERKRAEEERRRKEEEERRKEREEDLALARETGKQPLEVSQLRKAGFTTTQIAERAAKEDAAKERLQRTVRESDPLMREAAERTDPFMGDFAGQGLTGRQRRDLVRPSVLPSTATDQEGVRARDEASRTERGIKAFQAQNIQARKDRLEDEARQAREGATSRIQDPVMQRLWETKQATIAQAGLVPDKPPKDPHKDNREAWLLEQAVERNRMRQQWATEAAQKIAQQLGPDEQGALMPLGMVLMDYQSQIKAIVDQKETQSELDAKLEALKQFPKQGGGSPEMDAELKSINKQLDEVNKAIRAAEKALSRLMDM